MRPSLPTATANPLRVVGRLAIGSQYGGPDTWPHGTHGPPQSMSFSFVSRTPLAQVPCVPPLPPSPTVPPSLAPGPPGRPEVSLSRSAVRPQPIALPAHTTIRALERDRIARVA